MKQENGYGSITKLSGKRRKPYVVRGGATYNIDLTTGKMIEKRPIIGTFATKREAAIELAKYNENPYDLKNKQLTFSDVYDKFYERKYIKTNKNYSESSKSCTKSAFTACASLHKKLFREIKAEELQEILDRTDLSHSYLEHIKYMFNQMYKYALQYEIVEKNYSQFAHISKPDDVEHGVPFSPEDISALWENIDYPYVDTILILIYSGWRISELLNMRIDKVDILNRTFQGGVKTDAGKDRIVPIHSKTFDFVEKYYNYNKQKSEYLLTYKGKQISKSIYYKLFKQALKDSGIEEKHTPHDARHSFASLLDTAGANKIAIKLLMGHSIQDITDGVYTHKNIDELRINIELI